MRGGGEMMGRPVPRGHGPVSRAGNGAAAFPVKGIERAPALSGANQGGTAKRICSSLSEQMRIILGQAKGDRFPLPVPA